MRTPPSMNMNTPQKAIFSAIAIHTLHHGREADHALGLRELVRLRRWGLAFLGLGFPPRGPGGVKVERPQYPAASVLM